MRQPTVFCMYFFCAADQLEIATADSVLYVFCVLQMEKVLARRRAHIADICVAAACCLSSAGTDICVRVERIFLKLSNHDAH